MGYGLEEQLEYDPFEEGLLDGTWPAKDGDINVSDMSLRHLYNATEVCRKSRHIASFSCEAEKWQDWIDIFTNEILRRPEPTKKVNKKTHSHGRGTRTIMKCHCGKEYSARYADLKRGWGKSCGKRCAAIRREFGRPPGRQVKSEISL